METNTIEQTRIRPLKTTDMKEVLQLISEFYEEGLKECGLSFSIKTLEGTIKLFAENPWCVSLIGIINGKIKGIIAGMVQPSMFDFGELLAEEKIWFVSKDSRSTELGMRLLSLFEEGCKLKGAKHLMMINLEDVNSKIMHRFYHRQKYKLIETHFIKKLNQGGL